MSWRPRDASRDLAEGVVVGTNPITGKHTIREAGGSVARVRLRDVVWERREPSVYSGDLGAPGIQEGEKEQGHLGLPGTTDACGGADGDVFGHDRARD